MLKWTLALVIACTLSGGPLSAATPAGRPADARYESVAPKAHNEIDRLVLGQLQKLGLRPAYVCSDAVFVRRVYLDVIGRPPAGDEAKKFIADNGREKRRLLIDDLLSRNEDYAAYWGMRWGDLLRIKAEFPINLWPNAVQTYDKWVRDALRSNMPLDQFARELITASGSNFRDPPANFYRAMQNKDAKSVGQVVALTFMGCRAEKWPKEKQDGLTAFFSQVSYKPTGEWKEEIVYFDPSKQMTGAATFPDGTKPKLSEGKDPRKAFADWLVDSKNPYFAKAMSNRAWFWLVGRGIVHEPDDIRQDNPAANPELLVYLERELIASKYDMKHLMRLILNSQVYQLSSMPQSADPRGEAQFAYYPLRRLDAEVLADAVCQVTGSREKYTSPIPEPFTFVPDYKRSIELSDASISSSFLELFGRSPRDTGMATERSNRPSAAQRLHMLNSSHIQKKIEQSWKLQALVKPERSMKENVTALYLEILSRHPTDAEVKAAERYAKAGGVSSAQAVQDVSWALMNSVEFLYRH